MKLLFDANISYRIVKLLSDIYPDSLHVGRTGLPIPADDRDIWQWAKNEGFVIVTNDEDFLNLNILHGTPPQIVLLKIGNSSTTHVANILVKHRDSIEGLTKLLDYGVLEIYG